MDIVSSSYNHELNHTKVEVETFSALADGVYQRSGNYRVQLEGRVDHGSEEMLERVADRLEEAGVKIMPFD